MITRECHLILRIVDAYSLAALYAGDSMCLTHWGGFVFCWSNILNNVTKQKPKSNFHVSCTAAPIELEHDKKRCLKW